MTQMDESEEMKINNCIKQQMAKAKAETQAALEDKGEKKNTDVGGWKDERQQEGGKIEHVD